MASIVPTLKGVFSGDTLFIVIIFAFFFAYAMFMGRGRIISLILSFYPAVLLYNGFPFVNKLLVLHGDALIVVNKIVIFLIMLIGISIIINRYVVSDSMHSGAAHLLRTVGFAVCATVLVLVFSYATVSLDALHNFSPQIDTLFTGLDRIFYWNVGVLAVLAFL